MLECGCKPPEGHHRHHITYCISYQSVIAHIARSIATDKTLATMRLNCVSNTLLTSPCRFAALCCCARVNHSIRSFWHDTPRWSHSNLNCIHFATSYFHIIWNISDCAGSPWHLYYVVVVVSIVGTWPRSAPHFIAIHEIQSGRRSRPMLNGDSVLVLRLCNPTGAFFCCVNMIVRIMHDVSSAKGRWVLHDTFNC